MGYRIEGRTILSPNLEVDVVDHCNLACRSCSHLSPLASKKLLDVAELERDLSILATCFHAAEIRLVGGEPLLHPQLPELARAIRATGVADRVILMTNGLLLDRAPERLWDSIDCIEIYCYPGSEPSEPVLQGAERNGLARKMKVKIKRIDAFRESYSELPFRDSSLVQRVYSTCEIAHVWECHSVRDGYFYKCPEAHALPARLASRSAWKAQDDGIRLDRPETLFERLSAYLTDTSPLNACRHCLGTVGKLFPHEQVPRARWRLPQQVPPEELIDRVALFRLEHRIVGRVGKYLYRMAYPSSDPQIEKRAERSPFWSRLMRIPEKIGLTRAPVLRLFMAVHAPLRLFESLGTRVRQLQGPVHSGS